jgi:CheY-like chemotaxis protein
MTTPSLPLALSAPIPSPLKKKRVLLVDISASKRGLRAEIMRKLGIEVDCAADISEARCWWRADLYNLVLIDAVNNGGQRDEFCGEIRRATPPQQIAFLVGKPEYLADSPTAEQGSLVEQSNHTLLMKIGAALPSEFGRPPQRWGIMEASRRISAVRSASVVRTQAMRNLPAPLRDSEGRPSKRTTITASLDDLLREEMQ